MNDLSKACLEEAKTSMKSSINFLEKELTKIRAGKANPGMLDGVKVDYYGTMTDISQVANINTPDARSIVIQPWEKTLVGAINKAILDANLGFTPRHEGDILRIIVPPLTEERRKELCKSAKTEIENAKVNIRNVRRNARRRGEAGGERAPGHHRQEHRRVRQDLCRQGERNYEHLVELVKLVD